MERNATMRYVRTPDYATKNYISPQFIITFYVQYSIKYISWDYPKSFFFSYLIPWDCIYSSLFGFGYPCSRWDSEGAFWFLTFIYRNYGFCHCFIFGWWNDCSRDRMTDYLSHAFEASTKGIDSSRKICWILCSYCYSIGLRILYFIAFALDKMNSSWYAIFLCTALNMDQARNTSRPDTIFFDMGLSHDVHVYDSHIIYHWA